MYSPKYGTTEARVSAVDGKKRIWKFLPLDEAGFECEEGAWNKPLWVCIAVKETKNR